MQKYMGVYKYVCIYECLYVDRLSYCYMTIKATDVAFPGEYPRP